MGGNETRAIFAYGTLMRGERLHHHMLRVAPLRIAPAATAGCLIDLGGYPALIPGPGEVLGEIFEYADDLTELLRRLDRIEGPKYRRVARTVLKEDGAEQIAWLYEWVDAPDAGRVIPSGSWRDR